jgi:hypothetical protein
MAQRQQGDAAHNLFLINAPVSLFFMRLNVFLNDPGVLSSLYRQVSVDNRTLFCHSAAGLRRFWLSNPFEMMLA